LLYIIISTHTNRCR